MLRTRNSSDGPMYFFSQGTWQQKESTHGAMEACMSNSDFSGYRWANQVMIDFETDTIYPDLPVDTVKLLIKLRPSILCDLVDVWYPDAVSMDSLALITLQDQLGLHGAYLVLGYVNWLSAAVIDANDVPPAPIREPYAGGMLWGIDPKSRNPIADATKAAVSLYRSGKLRVIPAMQKSD